MFEEVGHPGAALVTTLVDEIVARAATLPHAEALLVLESAQARLAAAQLGRALPRRGVAGGDAA
jgi:hypothetical protein